MGHLRTILLEMDDLRQPGRSAASSRDCDTLFHRAIIDATGNQVLLKLWEQCNMRNWVPLLRPDGRDQSAAAPVRPPADFGGHLRRDVKTATSMLEDHLTGLMDGFIRGVKA